MKCTFFNGQSCSQPTIFFGECSRPSSNSFDDEEWNRNSLHIYRTRPESYLLNQLKALNALSTHNAIACMLLGHLSLSAPMITLSEECFNNNRAYTSLRRLNIPWLVKSGIIVEFLLSQPLTTRSELEWTIIFGLNCTKIYGEHMSSADFLRRTHVLHRFLRRTCVFHRFSVSGINFLCLVPDTENLWRTHVLRRNLWRTCVLRRKSVEDMCPP